MKSIKILGVHCFILIIAAIKLLLFSQNLIAEQLMFPAGQWGQARLAMPQSTNNLESLFRVGGDNFEPIQGFSKKHYYRENAGPVGRLDIMASDQSEQRGIVVCTAWLISTDKAMTNYHCLPGQQDYTPIKALLRLGYLSEKESGDTYPVDIKPLESDEDLDYSIIHVRNNPTEKYKYFIIDVGTPGQGEEFFIYHHPAGKPLQLTRKDCRALEDGVSLDNIGHVCSTLVGSSGAPIFSQISWKLVGLHYQGGLSQQNDSYNGAKRLDKILQHSHILASLSHRTEESNQVQVPDNDTEKAYKTCIAYYDRDGVNQDYEKSAYWCKLAAEKGHVEAQVRMGYMYYKGLGVTRDYAEAVRWYRKAAEAGHAMGMNNLGTLYESGLGLTKSYTEAVRWYRKAAEAGHAMGMNNLGYMYEKGLGVNKNYTEAVRWYRKAAEAGNAWGSHNLGVMYRDGLGLTKSFTEAVRWYRNAIQLGNSKAMTELGVMYRDGLGVARDYDEAIRWYRKAAEAGDDEGMAHLGYMYEKGLGVTRDYADAVRWYRKAAEAGNAMGMNYLGTMYEKGLGVTKNHTEAVRWHRKAADAGDKFSMIRLKE
jgi:TPR repeat protein